MRKKLSELITYSIFHTKNTKDLFNFTAQLLLKTVFLIHNTDLVNIKTFFYATNVSCQNTEDNHIFLKTNAKTQTPPLPIPSSFLPTTYLIIW